MKSFRLVKADPSHEQYDEVVGLDDGSRRVAECREMDETLYMAWLGDRRLGKRRSKRVDELGRGGRAPPVLGLAGGESPWRTSVDTAHLSQSKASKGGRDDP